MVDIHSHILPGWDDGSTSMEQSLEMLKIAVESGTTAIVATPHANTEFHFQPDIVNGIFAELKRTVAALPALPIDLHLGCDFHIQFENVQDALANPTKYTIDHGAYLMVELPEVMNFAVIRDILGRLRDEGMITVITHPERNMQLQSNLGELDGWVQSGALLQVTGQSLLGRFGKIAHHCANQLLKDNLVHFIASDAHDTQDRTPNLREAYRWMESKYGKRRAERLFQVNPAALISGAPIEMDDGEITMSSGEDRKWWAFWK
jgi:protein-tyrosine phosphatase